MINFETYHEVRRLSRELNLSPAQMRSSTVIDGDAFRKIEGN